ncbi:hypothetical protein INT43_002482 [Umbelopsis isabellina]|uniref:Uncharacterized protein n=1 Tax=Mortierella isabellina TaxID=91625 RepID=A0A8H7Q3Y2_MORIS|nr:hypothetical protein INT43_002482 [Umbelopsis isabellina]
MTDQDDKTEFKLSEPPFAAWTVYTHGPLAVPLLNHGDRFDQTVYQDIETRESDFTVISKAKALQYLPKRKESVTISVGIEKQTNIKVGSQDSADLQGVCFKYKKGYVINTGGSIWGLDFVPKPTFEAEQYVQYLAVAGYPGTNDEHHNVGEIQEPGTVANCIQIWRMDLRLRDTPNNPTSKPKLDLCITHDLGISLDGQTILPRLGILAVAFGDGSIRIISVPHPDGLRRRANGGVLEATSKKSDTVYIHLKEELATLSIPETCMTTLSWGGPYKLAAGCSKGSVSIWNVETAIRNRVGSNKKTAKEDIASVVVCSVRAHSTATRSVTYHYPLDPDGHEIASSGHDGRVRLCDDRDPWTAATVWKNRGFLHTVDWPMYTDAVLFPDVERVLRSTRTAPNSEYGVSKKLVECRGDIWQISSSYFHPFAAMATSDGWLKLNNAFHGNKRGEKFSTINVYRLKKTEVQHKYQYVDSIKDSSLSSKRGATGESLYYLFLDPEVAIQRCIWNPNRATCGWIASGGAAGLCRIDFVGSGKDWLKDLS